MIIYTKYGNKISIPYLTAFHGGAWCFSFFEDYDYIDPHDGSTWYWVGTDHTIVEIIAVFNYGIFLIRTTSEADCEALDKSFFWDDVNGILYIRWPDSFDDHAVGRAYNSMSQLVHGYANGYSRINQNVFDGLYYDPIIVATGGLSKKVDPLKLGLIAYENSSYSFTDENNTMDMTTGQESIGNPVIFYEAEKTDMVLTDAMAIFTGYENGYTHNRDEIYYDVKELRNFNNSPVCVNIATITEFPDIDNEIDKPIPVAFGDIRRGIMLLTNKGVLTEALLGSAVFLVADPSVLPVLGIDNVYNKAGELQNITAVDLVACTVTVDKPIDISPGDLKDWTWEGQGYDIDGTYNNGLDIIRAAFLLFASIPFLNSLFETVKWTSETVSNPDAVGISIQSDKGFIEEIVEPVCASLQGVVEIMGDGRISWSSRDLTVLPITSIPHICAIDQIDYPKIKLTPEQIVSELAITYAPNFKVKDDLITYVYTVDRDDVIVNYNINRREPISPLKTILFDEADVLALAIEVMSTSAGPERIITVEHDTIIKARLFSIIGIDTGLFGNERFEYGEILELSPDYKSMTQVITMRTIPGYVPLIFKMGFGFSNKIIGSIDYGYSNKPLGSVTNGYGTADYV